MLVNKKIIGCLNNKFTTVNSLNKTNLRLFVTQVAQKDLNVESPISGDTEWNSALPYEKIPGPGKFEIFRSFLPGGKFHNKSRYYITETLYKTYGDIIKIPGILKQPNIVFVLKPEYIEKIYRNDGIWPNRRGLETLTYYRHVLRSELFKDTGTLLTSNGEEWGKLRSQVNPIVMQPKTVKTYIPRMDKSSLKFIDRIRKIRDPATNEMPGDFETEINKWALEQICLVGLDNELGIIGNDNANSDAQKLIDAVGTLFSTVGELEFKPSLWKYYATSNYKKVIKAYDVLTDISLKYIDEAFERFKANEKTDTRNDNEKSIVERLIKIDKKVAVVMAMEMFFAGVDTTTSTFTACMIALSKNLEKQEKLRQEILKVLPDRDTPITKEILSNLPYLKAVIKESIRLYPIVHEFLRTSNVDFVLGQYQIPKNTDMLMYGTHFYEAEEHFSEPKQFIPERWLRNSNKTTDLNTTVGCPMATATKASNPFVYLPFGFGNRMCIGKRLVDMELEILLTRIVRNFNIEYNYDDKDVFELKLIYTPGKELKFKLTDLNN